MRPTLDEYYVNLLAGFAARGTCARRQVAAILVDESGRILASAYNGPAAGQPHCIDTPCAGAGDQPGDTSRCEAVHAEQNVIIQSGLSGNLMRAHTLYCTASPCLPCCKLLANVPNLERVVYLENYADQNGIDLLKRRGTKCIHFETSKV